MHMLVLKGLGGWAKKTNKFLLVWLSAQRCTREKKLLSTPLLRKTLTRDFYEHWSLPLRRSGLVSLLSPVLIFHFPHSFSQSPFFSILKKIIRNSA